MQQSKATIEDPPRTWHLLHEVGNLSKNRVGNEVFNLLMVFYSIEISTLLTLVLYTVTHLTVGIVFLASVWIILIALLCVSFYTFVASRAKKMQVKVSSILVLGDNATFLQGHQISGGVNKVKEVQIPQVLRAILDPDVNEMSSEINIRSTMGALWEIMKIHSAYLLKSTERWLRTTYETDIMYLTDKCSHGVQIVNTSITFP